MDLSPVRVPCDRLTGGTQRGGGHCGSTCVHGPVYWCRAECVPLCGVKAAGKGGGMGSRRQLTAIPSVSVELLSGSSQQLCYSGVGIGVQGVREQGRDEGALLQDGLGPKGVGEEEVVPAGRKGHGDGNAGSEGIWGLLASASSLAGKLVSGPVSCRWRSLHGVTVTFYPSL